MSSLDFIHSLPIPSGDVDIFAADARKLYRHAKEPKFLFLIVSGEGILVHDDYREVRCAACSRKIWEHRFDRSDEVGFFPRKLGLVPVRHFQRPPPSLKDIVSSPENTSSPRAV
jgi:hypothetical protein